MTVPECKLIQEALKARGLYSGSIDGEWGAKSQAAFIAYVDGQTPKVTPHDETASSIDGIDDRSAKNILTLHPRVRATAAEFVRRLNSKPLGGLVFRITSALRTYEEQDELYEQGRTKSGDVVTNARGGFSNHNFGLAWDCTLFRDTQPIYESDLYRYVGEVAKEMGLVWGGDWGFDKPHVEVRPDWAKGLGEIQTVAELRHRHESGKDLFVGESYEQG